MNDSWLRVRAILDSYFEGIVVAALLVALVGGFLTYSAYAQPNTETEVVTETVSSWTSTGDFDHRATVVNGSRAFSEGTVLRNRSVYFQRVAPTLDGSFSYIYNATESGSVATTASLELVVRSVERNDQDNVTGVYWQFEDPLGQTSATLEPGERVAIPFSQNVSAIGQEIERVESQLGGTAGQTEVLVRATVRLDGTRNGRDITRTRTYTLPLTIETGVYRVGDASPVTHSGEQTAQRQVTNVVPASPVERVGGPPLLLVGLGGVALLGAGRYREEIALSDPEREYLAYRRDRSEFDEWITEARVPDARLAGDQRVEATSLSGLVDVAIDSDRRVIETTDGAGYFVLDGDVIYSYDPPRPVEDGSDPLATMKSWLGTDATPGRSDSGAGDDAEPSLDGSAERDATDQ